MAEKKHEKIRKEIKRMNRADETYCNINSCTPSDFMMGKAEVYRLLLNFIDKL